MRQQDLHGHMYVRVSVLTPTIQASRTLNGMTSTQQHSSSLFAYAMFHKECNKPNLGDSSPVSSSPRTPCLNVVSNIPAVWYLSENALSLGKNPICRLLMMRRVNKVKTTKWKSLEKLKTYTIMIETTEQLLPVDTCRQWTYWFLWFCILPTQLPLPLHQQLKWLTLPALYITYEVYNKVREDISTHVKFKTLYSYSH